MRKKLIAGLTLALALASNAGAEASTCFGTVANGRLEKGVALPREGGNFSSYSALGSALNRTHVHSKIADIVVAAYQALETSAPATVYVFGETGWPAGGRIQPHRTHQNGLSVDFMVPVRNPAGRSVPLPTGAANKFGYAIDFDGNGRYDGYRIDFEAIGEHLYQLDRAAKARGAGIAQVIFERPYLPRLFATRRGAYLKSNINFMRGKPWVRHDEHYHVDFAVACRPMKG